MSLSRPELLEAVRAAGIDVPARYLDVTASTNSDLLQMAQAGAPDWSVVATGHQTAGRGRLGRTWESAPGTSLSLSVLVRPEVDAGQLPLASLAAGVAMAEACRAVAEVDVGCKWPNDLVVGERKVGGILSEAAVRSGRALHVVIGVGLNLRQRPEDLPEDIRPTASSLAMEGADPDAARLVTAFLTRLRGLLGERGDPTAGILEPYRRLCASLGRTVRATTSGGRAVEGRAVDVADSGELLVQTVGGVERVAFGEVVHLR